MRTPIPVTIAVAFAVALTWFLGGASPAAENAAASGPGRGTAASANDAAADTAADAATSPGPVGLWKLDDGGGDTALDSSGNGLHGALLDMQPKWSWIPGKFGRALRFDSFDDRVEVPADERLRLTDELTVEAWVRFGSFGSGEDMIGNGLFRIYHRGSWAGHRLYFLYRVEEPELYGDSSWPNWAGVRTDSELEHGRWYHVAAVMSDASTAIYLNGVRERELDALTGLTKDDSDFAELLLGAAPFGGSLDEVAIYDRALGSDEIAAHASRGYWRLDETGGTVAADGSPYSNDCALHGMSSDAAWGRGRIGGALSFDGVDDYADCGSDASLDVAGDVTIELWARFDGFSDRQEVIGNGRYLVAARADGAAGEGILGDVFFLQATDAPGQGGDSPWEGWTGVRSPTQVTAEEWHHLLAVKRGDEMQLYVDGQSAGPVACLAGLAARAVPAGPLRLGAAPFKGSLDQISISESAISDAEAERRYRDPDSGAHTNPTGNPIGGGPGYSRLVDPTAAVYHADNLADLLHGLTQGANGDIVYVADDAVIDLTGQVGLSPRRGVTLASGRGRVREDGTIAPGALLFTNQQATSPLFQVSGEDVRVTGLRLRGPNTEILDRDLSAKPLAYGITSSHPSFEIDNCELWGWGGAAIVGQEGATDAHIHHNSIHHNRRAGYGYGVTLSRASALIEANIFDYNRHHVIGSGRPGTSIEARHNVLLGHASAYDISMYGARDYEWSISKGNWRFDEGRGRLAEDTSSYADNDCAVTGPVWVEGRVKSALLFDGVDDQVRCGAGQRLNLTERVTLEAWIKPRSLPARDAGAGIVGKSGGAADWAGVPYQLAQLRSGALTFSIGDGTEHEALDVPIPSPGVWHHVTGVFEPGHMYAYRDGELVAETRTEVKPLLDESLELHIGRWHETFDGAIDEVRLFSAALDTDQVRVHMSSPDIAGERTAVHHNTYLGSLTPSLVIRGRPAEGAEVHHNWFRWPDRASAVRQYYADENLDVHNNVYGSEPPEHARLPRAVAIAEPHGGTAPLAVRFDGESSFDPTGDLLGHRWLFADGASSETAAEGASATHTFELPGRYDVELTATGRSGVPDVDTLRVTVAPAPGTGALSLWVKDSYVGELAGRYVKQALIGQDVVWEDDVAGDEGWQHVVVDSTELLAGRERITVTLRAAAVAPITEPLTDIRELMVYWDDVAVFDGAVANEGFESAAGWAYSEEPRGTRWTGVVQGGDVQSGDRAFMVSYPYNVATETGTYAQIQQVVESTRTYLPHAQAHR